MIHLKIIYIFLFSFIFLSVHAFQYDIPESQRGQKLQIPNNYNLVVTKHSTIRVTMDAMPSPGNSQGYLYPGVIVYRNGTEIYRKWGEPTYNNPTTIDIPNVAPGTISVVYILKYPGSVTSVQLGCSIFNECPNITNSCSQLTCPHCKTSFCTTHELHYSATFSSDSCKISMHTFCTDNKAAYDEYASAPKVTTCSLCNSPYCKLCGHSCSSSGSGCPNTSDCIQKQCSTCKSSFCEKHSFHLCSPIGNNNNNSGGSWSVWTEKVGVTENVNVQADFTPLVNAQNNANVLLNNINSALPGFVTDINNTINNVDSTLKDKINPNLDDMRTNLSNISSDIKDTISPRLSDMLTNAIDISNNTGYIATEFVKVLDNLSNISEKSNTIDSNLTNTVNQIANLNSLILQSNSTASDQLIVAHDINSKLTVSNANLSSLSSYASSTNTNVQMMKQILSNDIVVSLVNHLNELKKQSGLQENDIAIQDAIKNFLIDNVHPVLKDTKEFQSLIRSDLSLLAADLAKMKSNSDTVTSNTDHLLNNSNYMRIDVSDIKKNTDSIKDTASGVKQNTDSIKETALGIKLNTDSIKDDSKAINDKLDAQGKLLDNINTSLTPSNSSLPARTITYSAVDPASEYTKVEDNLEISSDKLDSRQKKIEQHFENLPEIESPAFKPLIVNVPLKTSFQDFSFSFDLKGGPHAQIVTQARSVSYSIFACFWVLLFSFLFIKSLRQW